MNELDIPSSSAIPPDFLEEIYGIKFTLSTTDEMDTVAVGNWDNLTFSFSGNKGNTHILVHVCIGYWFAYMCRFCNYKYVTAQNFS